MDDKKLLAQIARKTMLERDLSPDFPLAVLKELETINSPATKTKSMQDLRHFLWCSIDNDDSRDLDQLTYAQSLPDGGYVAYIAVADVDVLVSKNSAIDLHAQINTTSVYTPGIIFPMLPEKLSTNLTSLNEGEERAAMIFEISFDSSMMVAGSKIYPALVLNKAQLAYSSVGPWLVDSGPMPEKIASVPGLTDTLHLQDQLAQSLKRQRLANGALNFETLEVKPEFADGRVAALIPQDHNRAHELIENFMIAANTASARFSIQQGFPSLRRIVRVPERWDRIVDLAAGLGYTLPAEPNAVALSEFLNKRKEAEPETFTDLSLTIIKLLGSGEYVVEIPGDTPIGHFGLAVRDYTHSTAPNRRYPDIITQRLLKSSLKGEKSPYSVSQLESLAQKCTVCEDTVAKVERKVAKSAAALLMQSHIGENFEAIVTGASAKGTWVRLRKLAVEGKLVGGMLNVDVGDFITVKLVEVDIMEGFIDFVRV